LRDVGDLDRSEEGGDVDRDRVDDHDEEAHRREQQAAGQRNQDRPSEAVDQHQDCRPRHEPDDAGATEREDRHRGWAERERLSDGDDPEQQDDEQEEDCVEEDLDDETAHGSPLVDVAAG
jgi:hypothetical protein